eukprot:201412_1
MACNDAEITPYDKSKTECNEAFDFAQWVESNELLPVKSLMIKHNLNTTDALSLTSPQYIQLLSDPALFQTKSNFISKIHKAIQSFTDANRSQSLDDFIVISEAERSVMDKLKQYIIELDKIEKNMKELKEKYPQSIQRIYTERDSQIEQAQQKINDTFNSIKDELNKRQQDLLDELIKMKEGNISIDDMKEIQLFEQVEKAVKIQKTKINNNLKLCNDTVITQKNKEREKRKQFILNIGQKCDKECNIQIQNMVINKQKVQELITKNNEYCVNISCNINEGKYKDLLESIHNLGVIENSEHKEITQVIIDDSTNFAITDDSFEEKDNKSNNLKVTTKQLYNIVNQWQQKYDNQINTFNIDTSKKCQLFENKYTHLMNSIERCKQKYDILAVSNRNLQKQNHNQSKEILKWQNKHNTIVETQFKLKTKYNTILNSLIFSRNSKFRWCKEEKEQYILVKELDKKQKTYISSKGMMKTVNDVCCQMENTVDVTQIYKWISVFRDTYEFATNSTDWTFDHWNSQLKHDHIQQ